ncbi:3-oxoacyl-[acyl-carrier protein] reductase [Natronorubrum sediminis]|uniref:3-oxoacyl-[acyl-carrier protein] reductase n=1 Tax=Natronorubrum sediminis TaxID=640943 RepID=A0A1H6G743_9EURY|nr:SDR family oxidoreductase [Natronorubrum sediminis]SEH18153.1 3-oxoacyl-[acyl-carrier protein] reductase [Natronorubrum sediminis]
MPAALITGGSRGIGRGIAEQYARDGYDVAVNYHSSETAAEDVVETIRAETDGDAVAIQADVSDSGAVESLVETTVETFGGLDHVVNNAAISQHKHTPELTVEEFDTLMQINATSVFSVTKAAHEHLLESAVGEGPSVINLSSRLAHAGAPHEPHYAASKAGIIAITKSHAKEFGPDIRVNAIAPGYIVTDMTDRTNTAEDKRERREKLPLQRLGEPEDVGQAAAYLRDARFVTGETLNVNGGQDMV